MAMPFPVQVCTDFVICFLKPKDSPAVNYIALYYERNVENQTSRIRRNKMRRVSKAFSSVSVLVVDFSSSFIRTVYSAAVSVLMKTTLIHDVKTLQLTWALAAVRQKSLGHDSFSTQVSDSMSTKTTS